MARHAAKRRKRLEWLGYRILALKKVFLPDEVFSTIEGEFAASVSFNPVSVAGGKSYAEDICSGTRWPGSNADKQSQVTCFAKSPCVAREMLVCTAA